MIDVRLVDKVPLPKVFCPELLRSRGKLPEGIVKLGLHAGNC